VVAVKGQTRKDKAAVTRSRMLTAAYDSFCELGYRATTMDAIAERAGVAVQTLYFTFHTKDDLLQAVLDRAVLGDEGLPPPMQPWYADLIEARRIDAAVRHFVDGVVAISVRVAPLLPTFHAVAGDPAGAVHRYSEALRRQGFVDLVALLAEKAPLRDGLTSARATDLLLVLAGPETYRSFVIDCGWSPAEYADWCVSAVLYELFDVRRRSSAAGRSGRGRPG
jgi:AcrR family transcriptional regulator